MSDSLGDRMKNNYELPAQRYLTRRVPVAIRCDGRSFHSYCTGFDKPFDKDIIEAMTAAAVAVAEEMSGFKIGYVQSDEATFILTDYDNVYTQAFFDYNQNKLESVVASAMTAYFNNYMHSNSITNKLAMFDARSFNIPENEISNLLLWRAKDWERNSISMYCRSFYSHKQMEGKNKDDQHEMLFSLGKNWSVDLSDAEKNGTFLFRGYSGINTTSYIMPQYERIRELVDFTFNATRLRAESKLNKDEIEKANKEKD